MCKEICYRRFLITWQTRELKSWNPKFLEQTGFSEDEMKSFKPEELLALGESWSSLSEENGKRVEYTSCAAAVSKASDALAERPRK